MSSKRTPDVADVAEQAASTAFNLLKQTAAQLHALYKDYQKKPGMSDEERIAKVVAEVFKHQKGPGQDLSSEQLKELLEERIKLDAKKIDSPKLDEAKIDAPKLSERATDGTRKMRAGSVGESLQKEGYFTKNSQGPAIKVAAPKLASHR
jgi:hypothetical protein